MKASGPPIVLKLSLGVSKGMLPVKYFHSDNVDNVRQISRRPYDCHKVELNMATLIRGDITGFKTVVYVCVFARVVLICSFRSCFFLRQL